jgi:hypothetical protein
MTTAWLLNTTSLFATTIGALLIFLYLYRTPRLADDALSPAAKLAYAKRRNLLTASVAILAAWLVLQCLVVIV